MSRILLGKWVIMPVDPSLKMMDEAWGICGTGLSSAEPNQAKIDRAIRKYRRLVECAYQPEPEDIAMLHELTKPAGKTS